MVDSPDIAAVAGLIGDRARAEILLALMGGRSLTATELARAARVTKQTASAHLSRLVAARLAAVRSQGRHRYFRLAGPEVGRVIESLMGLARSTGAVRVAPGPPDPALRKARVCYDHLAGELGVLVFDSLVQRGFVRGEGREPALTDPGRRFLLGFGIDLPALEKTRRPLCLACLDWSVRRSHLAGALGAAILDRCYALRWARPPRSGRAVAFSAVGERALRNQFRLASA